MGKIGYEEAEALIEAEIIPGVISGAVKESAAMSLMTKLPNMSSKQSKMKVLDMLPLVYWVDGDTGFKRTIQAAWENVYITAEELAVIVPISENVLEDSNIDIIGEIMPKINEAVGQAFDLATIFGINKPIGFRNDIITTARNAGNAVAIPASPNYFDLIMGENGVIAKVEESGFIPTGAVSAMTMRAKLRGLKDSTGHPIFMTSMQGATPYALDGMPMFFPENGGFDPSKAGLIVGNWKQAVYSIRSDIRAKILTEAVIQDPSTKDIVYNLAQQDMIAIRVTFRAGWALPNPTSQLNPDRIAVPFAYLEAKNSQTYPGVQDINFTVVNDSGDANPIENAYVTLGGQRLKTDATGKVMFKLGAGTYPLKVTRQGYVSQNESLVVASSTINKQIVLAKG